MLGNLDGYLGEFASNLWHGFACVYYMDTLMLSVCLYVVDTFTRNHNFEFYNSSYVLELLSIDEVDIMLK